MYTREYIFNLILDIIILIKRKGIVINQNFNQYQISRKTSIVQPKELKY